MTAHLCVIYIDDGDIFVITASVFIVVYTDARTDMRIGMCTERFAGVFTDMYRDHACRHMCIHVCAGRHVYGIGLCIEMYVHGLIDIVLQVTPTSFSPSAVPMASPTNVVVRGDVRWNVRWSVRWNVRRHTTRA